MNPFEGVWRPDPQRPGPEAQVDEFLLADGVYACLSSAPPYRVAADGRPQQVQGQERFDSLAVTVVDRRTVRKVAALRGAVTFESICRVGADGDELVETQHQTAGVPRAFDFATRLRRLGAGPSGSHLVSGRWQVVEADLPDHEEDTELRVAEGLLTMRDQFGRSFDARLDGTPAPYRGDARVTDVSVRWLDESTIEEVDHHHETVVMVIRCHVDPDARTMHVRFEHTDGTVQEQTGHRIG